MLLQLPEDALEDPRLHSLPKNLHCRGVVPGGKFTAVDALNLRLPEKPRTERSLHEGSGVDLVIGPGDDWEAADFSIHDTEGKAMSDGLMAGVVDAKSFDGAGDARSILVPPPANTSSTRNGGCNVRLR